MVEKNTEDPAAFSQGVKVKRDKIVVEPYFRME
jgi:hypothetical protein